MTRNSTPTLGALHPVLFFIVVYGLTLFMALFVCKTIYQCLQPETGSYVEVLQNTTPATASR